MTANTVSLWPPQNASAYEQAFPFHSSFHKIYAKLKTWSSRFGSSADDFFLEVFLFYSLAKNKFLDHRSARHLFRILISIHALQQRLIKSSLLSSESRYLAVRCFPTNLRFTFSSKSVLGCLIGFLTSDRSEFFDEKNLIIALKKRYPSLEYVAESFYQHSSRHSDLRVFYFELTHKNNDPFGSREIREISEAIYGKVEHSIQKFAEPVSLRANDEDLYKSLFVLGQEIQSLQDFPQVSIQLDRRVRDGIVFIVKLVQVAPFHRFAFKERRCGCSFISEKVLPVKKIEGHLIEARVLQAVLPIDPLLVRSNGALDQHAARRQMTLVLENIIGEFRDYNGGLFIKQQESLDAFKLACAELEEEDHELVESFFYSMQPIETQIILPPALTKAFFAKFLQNRSKEFTAEKNYDLEMDAVGDAVFFVVRTKNSSASEALIKILKDPFINTFQYIYSVVKVKEEYCFCALLLRANLKNPILDEIQNTMDEWCAKQHKQKVLRVALENTVFSLDPRIGGASASADLLRLLSEGLTRFNAKGKLENGAAEVIDVSSDSKVYTFHLRPSFWNDGTLLTAHDFAYAWKKILSPHFDTFFATLLYPIENAQAAKEGKVSSDLIGIHVVDDRTLQVKLNSPTPYFLDLLAHPPYFPVNREVDQRFPQWPYQTGKNYPCNGPFQLKMNDPQRGYQLVKNPHYWETSAIVLDQIMLIPMDSNRAVQALHKNEVDWIGSPFARLDQMQLPYSDDHFRVLSLPDSIVMWMIFNTTHPLLSHPKIRRAFTFILDRQSMVSALFPSQLTPAYSLLPTQCRFSQGCVFPERDAEMACKLFYEALEELHLVKEDLPVFSITFLANIPTTDMIAQQLKKLLMETLAIDCVLKPSSVKAFFPQMSKGDFDIALCSWTSWIKDPIYTLNAFRFVGQGGNISGWESEEFNQALAKSEMEANPFHRASHLLEAEQILFESVPAIPLLYHPFLAVTRDNSNINPAVNFNTLYFNTFLNTARRANKP